MSGYTEFRQKDGYGGHLATWQADAQVRTGSGGGGAVIVTPIGEELGEHANCTISCVHHVPFLRIRYIAATCPPILPAVSSACLIRRNDVHTNAKSESESTPTVRNAIIGARVSAVGTSAESILGSGSVVNQRRRFLYN
ncbi:hypothetical protein E4U59_000957 [Claviceps monticola]|nr:hypothetical protein E4U59_000957 [Claviceps monticola]